MEVMNIKVQNEKAFDEAVHGDAALPCVVGELSIVTKDKGTDGGRAIACVHFDVVVGDEPQIRRAQITTTVVLLKALLRVLDRHYDDNGMPRAS